MLLQMASEKLGVPVDRLTVSAGVVSDKTASGKKVSYGQLVDGKKIERHLPKVPIKAYAALRLPKQHLQRKDALAKVTGKAEFTGRCEAAWVALRAHSAAPGAWGQAEVGKQHGCPRRRLAPA